MTKGESGSHQMKKKMKKKKKKKKKKRCGPFLRKLR